MKSIVIGSGFGGIAAALRLKAKNHNVTLIEKHADLGGRARIFKKNGFTRVSTRWDSRVPYGDAFYMRNTNLSNVFQYFNNIKNNFLETSIYFMLLKIFDLKKNYVLLKKIIKKIILRK